MADREQPYDPYIPSGSGNAGQTGGNQRTAALQAVSIPSTPSSLAMG
jgi:vesicle-associated membrane protein 4